MSSVSHYTNLYYIVTIDASADTEDIEIQDSDDLIEEVVKEIYTHWSTDAEVKMAKLRDTDEVRAFPSMRPLNQSSVSAKIKFGILILVPDSLIWDNDNQFYAEDIEEIIKNEIQDALDKAIFARVSCRKDDSYAPGAKSSCMTLFKVALELK